MLQDGANFALLSVNTVIIVAIIIQQKPNLTEMQFLSSDPTSLDP